MAARLKRYNTGETDCALRAKYNPEGSELRRAQIRMLEMLAFLDDVCKTYDITYFIAFGTLLGAVRHGGFIPWDDDLDVYINDKDLVKLRKIINESDCDYVVQDYTVDHGFVRYYNVLRDLKSEYIKDEFEHNQKRFRGLQIDLFQYETGVNEFVRRIFGQTFMLNEKFFLGRSRLLSSAIFNVNRNIAIPLAKKLPIGNREKVSLGYESGCSGYSYPLQDVFPLRTIEFEGIEVSCPNNPKNVLAVDYGPNWTDLPPETERNAHEVDTIRIL